ncbi:hypothetical protein M0R45_037108 [Rubus argutus]|uniref:Uncharacterized protein n=1 Tax=Rubus argutus TaxID=59490 RepID=A0AAW1W1E3_RUBAR
MSFRFPKPTMSPCPPEPCYYSTDANYAELLLRLSIFGFGKLSVSDQQDKTEEMREKVVEDVIVEQFPKESDEAFRLRMFTDLFKKLPMAEQNLFRSSVVKIFKHHRRFDELISWFKQLGARDQQRVIENMVPPAAVALSFPRETVDDFRLRRFTQLSAVYTDYAYYKYRKISDEEGDRDGGASDEDSPEASGDDDECSDEATYEDKDQDNVVKMSRFAEFFLGFSIVWFEGQSWANQGLERNMYISSAWEAPSAPRFCQCCSIVHASHKSWVQPTTHPRSTTEG